MKAQDDSPHTQPSTRGLYDDFEGYRTPTEDDYQRLLTMGLVVPDANVLLNLYRYDDAARSGLLRVFRAVGDRLWVPHQVLAEFWKNREAVLRDPRDTHKTVRELAEHRDKAVQLFHTWANRVSLETANASDMAALLSDAFASLADRINERDLEDASVYAQDTARDPVLQELEPLLERRCGTALTDDDLHHAITEGMRRVEARIPPGYMDKAKGDREAAGDYIVWEQILREAHARAVDVLFVTGDAKEDWWRIDGGERRGPRLELVREMQIRAGVRLFVLRPASLLEHAAKNLSVEVPPGSAQEVDRVEKFLADAEDKYPSAWDEGSVSELLRRLDAQAPVQADVVRRAALHGGFAAREEVYQLGGYDGERGLRGFTRPVNRIAQELRSHGLVGESAAEVLATRYDGGVVATGFDLNPEIVEILAPDAQRVLVLRALHQLLRNSGEDGVSIDELAKASGVESRVLEAMLDRLAEDDLVVLEREDDVTNVMSITATGRAVARMLFDIDVVQSSGDIVLADVELTEELSQLIESGFNVRAAMMGDGGTANIVISGVVNEENLELVRSLHNARRDSSDNDDHVNDG